MFLKKARQKHFLRNAVRGHNSQSLLQDCRLCGKSHQRVTTVLGHHKEKECLGTLKERTKYTKAL